MLRIGQHQLEATSYRVPAENERRMVVVLREIGTGQGAAEIDFDAVSALNLVSQINQALVRTTDLESNIETILENVQAVIRFDAAEVNYWEASDDLLRPVGRLGDSEYTTALVRAGGVYRMDEGFSGWLARYRQPLVINDISARDDVAPKLRTFPYTSFIGIPLLFGENFLGTLEIVSRERNAFDYHHLNLLQSIASQVAVTIENARLSQEQMLQVAKLDGLQKISGVLGGLASPKQMFRALHENLAELLNVDLCAILLHDAADNMLEAQPGVFGMEESLIGKLNIAVAPGSEAYKLWHDFDYWLTNNGSADPKIIDLGLEEMVSLTKVQSLGLVPMHNGTERIGALLIGHPRDGMIFTQSTMARMQVFATETGMVIENARLFQTSKQRTQELQGLQVLAQSIGHLHDLKRLHSELTSQIAELLDVKYCGLWLRDTESQALVAQTPFYGMVRSTNGADYSIPAESIFLKYMADSQPLVRADNPAQLADIAPGVQRLATQVGMEKNLLVHLSANGQTTGILHVADRQDGEEFSAKDEEMLRVYAGQAAMLVHNARDYADAYQRAFEADGLRTIAQLLSNTGDVSTIIQDVLAATTQLLNCEVISLGLLDAETDKLVYAPENTFGRMLEHSIELDIFNPGFGQSVVLSRQPFISSDVQNDERVLAAYETVARRMELHSAVMVPLVTQNRSIGEIGAYNQQDGQFAIRDQELLQSIAGQISAAIERTRLYYASDVDLRARVEELSAVERIGQALAERLELDHILDVTHRELLRSLPADGVSVVLLAPAGDWYTEDEPLIERRVGLREVFGTNLSGIEQQAVAAEANQYIANYHQTDLQPVPTRAQSAFVELLSFEGQILGFIHVHSQETNAFDDDQQAFIQRLAQQSALAIANAQRYREQIRANEALRLRADQLTEVYTFGKRIREGDELPAILESLARGLSKRLGFQKVLIRLLNEQTGIVEPIAQVGLLSNEFEIAKRAQRKLDAEQSPFQSRWKLSNDVYFLPAEHEEEWFTQDSRETLTDQDTGLASAWQNEDLLLAPIRRDNDDIIGWVSVDAPLNRRRPTLEIAESLEVFAKEASFAVTSHRTLSTIRRDSQVIRAERDRLALLHLVASEIQRTGDMASRLQAVVNGVQAVGWHKVRLSLRDENLDIITMVHTGYSEAEVRQINAMELPGPAWQQRLADDDFLGLELGGAFYLRYDSPWVQAHVLRGQTPHPPSVAADKWHPQDIIFLPLYGQNEDRIIAIMAMETPVDNRRPTEETLQPIELFATQAAAAIESTRLYLETVMQKETEQRLTELMESVSATLDIESVLRTLAEGLQQMVAFTRMHVGLPARDGKAFNLRRVEVTGDQKVHIFDDEPIKMTGSAMAVAFNKNERLLYSLKRTDDAGSFSDLRRWYRQGERITLMVPMIAGGETLGVLRLGSELQDAFGFREQTDLVARLANLAAVSINHTRLLEDLTASTAYNEAVVESIQQGIIVLDADHRITTLNTFIQQRYGWSEDDIGKRLYEREPEFEVFLKHSINIALTEGRPQHQFEVQDFDKDNNRIIRNFYTYPLQQGETVSGVVLLIEDVTERAMLESDLAQRAEQLRALTEVSSKITSSLKSDEVVDVVLEALENVMPFDGVTLWLREETGQRLRVHAARGYRDPGAAADNLVGLYVDVETAPLFKEIADEQKVLNVGDTGADDPRFPYGAERLYKNWLGAPLISQGEVVGVIALEKRQTFFYSGPDEQLLQNFANQASIALRNAQLFEQTTQRAAELDLQTRRLQLLNNVAVSLAQSLDIENIFETTLRETALALEIDEAAALKIDHEHDLGRVVVQYPRGEEEPNEIFALSQNFAYERVNDSLQAFILEADEADPSYQSIKPWLRRPADTQSILVVPLVVGGSLIGLIHFDALDEDYRFTQERIEIANTLASQAAIAVQNATLFEQSLVRTHELETLFEASQATAVTLDLDEAMRRVVSQMLSALRADYCSIALWDDIEMRLEVREGVSAWGEHDENEMPGTVYELANYPVREQVLRQRDVMNLRYDRDVHPSEKVLMERSGTKDRLLVPLVVNDFSIGLVDLEIREQNRFFEAGDIRLARTLASQSAVAIENARLQTETRSQIEELYIINDISRAASSKMKIDELFPMVRDQLPVLTDADILYVALYDDETHQITFPIAEDIEVGPVEMAARELGADEFSYVIERKAPLLLWGMQMAHDRESYGIQTILPDALCFLGVPMVVGEDIVGVLAVQDNADPRAFGLNDQRILTTVASQLAVAIQNARLFAKQTSFAEELEKSVNERTYELQQERERVQTLYDITTEASASLDINRVLTRALEKVAQATGATSGIIMGIDEVSEQLYVMHAYGDLPQPPPDKRRIISQDRGLAGWVLENRQSVVIPDVQTDERWVVRDDRDTSQRSVVAALLEVGEDSRGVMMLFSDEVNHFTPEHLKLVTAAASQLANSMNNAELYSLIRDQAERLGAILRAEQVESTKNTAILDSIADGVMYANEHGTVVLFNQAAERILDLPASRVVARPITELTGLYGGSTSFWMDAMERWMSDPSATRGEDFVEETMQLEDERIINIRLSPVNMGDQFLGTVSVFRDITKEVEVDRMKSEFVSTVSHELRTPMTSIKGYADLLLLGAAGEISEAQQRFLETIKQNADRLSILVNDLLEVSRIDQDRVPLRFTGVSVDELLSNIEAHLLGRVEDQKRPMNITLDVPKDLPRIRADYDRITQIVQNLADNAFNYTPNDGHILLRASLDDEKSVVVMSVQDNGIGIPESIQPRIFERFFRGDEYDDLVLDTPGTGLGLSIVKSLVEMHDGAIWFKSQPGQGTTFFVQIPVYEEPATEGA
ncbi:MAG: GAF domain-containing protein [Anaerolineales bacterium]